MSKQYPGGIISKTAPVPSGPYENSSAPGVWTLEQQAAYAKLGQWPTAGNIQNFFIEDVFSTYLYTGNGSSQTITNGIDLSTKGGMVWIKCRTPTAYNNWLSDTVRGNTKRSSSNTTSAESTLSTSITSFNSNGFSIGSNSNVNDNGANETFVSWTWAKTPKFFDVVTYTGNGNNRQIAHNLGSVPGFIIIKRTDSTSDWTCYHRSLGNQAAILLNTTAASFTTFGSWDSTTPTSTEFTLSVNATVNSNGGTYVAYLFAHDAGGFGLTGTDNVISCGSFTTDGSGNATVNLGYEPQWLLLKRTDASNNWFTYDNMRGIATGANDPYLIPNSSNAENGSTNYVDLSSTGFIGNGLNGGAASASMIYIAIRRGPMKVPTSGTSVFQPITAASDPTNVNVGFPTDLFLANNRAGSNKYALSRLTGGPQYLTVNTTASEQTYAGTLFDLQNNFTSAVLYGATNTISYMFRRAPSFFDEVCYTGNNVSGRTITHNLAAVPELMIVKSRTSTTRDWMVYDATNSATNAMNLNNDSVTSSSSVWASTAPTSTVFTVSDSSSVNDPAQNYVAYLFATCAGVSKVFSYTGNGSSQTINCGFTGGARFVLIKRTNAAGDWYVWDTARGIVSGNDPHLSLNTTAAEVTTDDTIDTDSTGFVVNQVAATNVNVSSATYIGLAIA